MRTALTVLLLSIFTNVAGAADDWNQFRGPDGTGVSSATDLPVEWSESKNIVWKTEVPGKAWSSPVVWDKQVWVTNAPEDGTVLSAVCLDLDSGEVIHDIVVFEIKKPMFCHPMNSYATPTPVVEEGRVYVHFGSAGTACLDTTTGKTIWARQDMPCDHFRGPGSSPIVFKNLLILTFDGFDYQYVTALDKTTGKTIWRTDRDIDYGTDNGDYKKAYSTPSVFDVAGQQQLVSPTSVATISYDVNTGKPIWKVRTGGFNNAARPFLGHGMVYVNMQGGFKLAAIRPDGKGNVTDTHVAWKYSKTVPTRPSQLLLGDRIFMVSDNGIVTCLNAKTGEEIFVERMGGKHSASPIAAEGRIYFFGEDGEMRVIEAADEYRLIADNSLNTGCMASPAVAGNALLVRTKTHLYKIAKE